MNFLLKEHETLIFDLRNSTMKCKYLASDKAFRFVDDRDVLDSLSVNKDMSGKDNSLSKEETIVN